MSTNNPFDDASLIYRYTRQQAIEDGVLMDLTEWACETGLSFPLAVTSTSSSMRMPMPRQRASIDSSSSGT